MTSIQEKIIKPKLGLLELAKQLGSVSQACRSYDYNNVRPHSSLGNQTPAQARRTLELSDGSAPGALAQTETADYENQTCRLSL